MSCVIILLNIAEKNTIENCSTPPIQSNLQILPYNPSIPRLTIKARCPMLLSSFPMDWQSCPLVFGSCKTSARLVVISQSCPLVAYPASQVFYHWHDPTLAVAYEGKLQLSQFDIINTKYRQINCSRSDANTGQTVV